jgi:uncharacterized RDD family membrane protein YckC
LRIRAGVVKLSDVERPQDERNAVVGLAVSAGRLGIATGRLVLLPARVVARTTLREPIVRAGSESVTSAARSAGASARERLETATVEVLLAPETAHAVDRVLASPLPEAVGRSLAERQVVERVVAEMLASTDLEAVAASVLENDRTGQLVEQVLASPALERLLTEVVESRLTAELAEKLVGSPEFDRLLEQAVSSPAVRAALARQTSSLGADTAAGLRRRAVRLDDDVERAPRRWFRKAPRIATRGGVATRGIALATDALLAQLLFLICAAMVGLVASLVGGLKPTWLAAALGAAGWLLVVGTYFVAFWTGAGQTPGMRLMRLRLLDGNGSPPGFWRSLVRLVGLGVAIAIVFTGFLPALVDDRRRALQDFLAGTTVFYDEQAPLPAGETAPVAAPEQNRLPATIPGR